MCKKFLQTVVLSLCFWVQPVLAIDPEKIPTPAPNQVTLLELGADFCPPCKMMFPIMERISKDYEGKAKIYSLDIQNYPELKAKYHLLAIPTLIFYDRSGKERDRHIGFLPEEMIRDKLDSLLAEERL